MTRIIPSLADISDPYDTLYCDLWGCIHNGRAPYPAAVAALQAFRAKGGRVVLLTNAPRPQAGVRAQLDRLGVPQDAWDLIASSGDAAQAGLFGGMVGRRV
ncbi:MAG: TIGR01459 family HAD-type hydrolase, partial [Defluviimonas denitrificans]